LTLETKLLGTIYMFDFFYGCVIGVYQLSVKNGELERSELFF
jgi:cbb3-type cytochrome oxidase subunit 3